MSSKPKEEIAKEETQSKKKESLNESFENKTEESLNSKISKTKKKKNKKKSISQNPIDKILDLDNPLISVSGPALAEILEKKYHNSEIIKTNQGETSPDKLLEFIRRYGLIFYRMKPKNKAELVEFYKTDKVSIVLMCGDSSNDIPAIKEADIGIIISQEKQEQCHFSMKESSIKCVETIIKTGRACHHYTFVITQSMLMYTLLRVTSTLALAYAGSEPLNTNYNFTFKQYFYLDCFCMMIPSIMGAWTAPNENISKNKIPRSLFNAKSMIFFVGQFAIFIGGLIGFFFYLKEFIDLKLDNASSEEQTPCILNSYLFLLNAFLILMCNLVLNISSKHRTKFYTNILFLGSELIMIFITLLFVCIPHFKDNWLVSNIVVFEKDSVNFEHIMEFNKFILQIFFAGTAIASVTYQYTLDYCLRD